MPKLDGLKEELAYLKLWLGILIVTAISLVGWLLTSFHSASWFLLLGGFAALLSIAIGCFALHRQIGVKIREIAEI
ncbi:hypothetical protein [Kushneria aurantia]|uniref:Uncharacterized protein n=1 Tax=Kushneria aurantia TaxID=504092 RepID=A0ABV6G0Q9_9GAMM|nr:hypothetical protein [Kushneria aurantia]